MTTKCSVGKLVFHELDSREGVEEPEGAVSRVRTRRPGV